MAMALGRSAYLLSDAHRVPKKGLSCRRQLTCELFVASQPGGEDRRSTG
jgi:hypothetical protein